MSDYKKACLLSGIFFVVFLVSLKVIDDPIVTGYSDPEMWMY